MKVLIADDEIIIREGMAKVIAWSEFGFTLLKPASSAEEVIDRLEDERPDILVTDIRMKGMSGLELVSYIAKSDYQIESILLTGYDEFDYIQEAIRQDVCDYLLKTSSPDEILTAVERARKRLEKVKVYDQWKESEVDRFVTLQLKEALQKKTDIFNFQPLVEIIPELKEPPFQLMLIDAITETDKIRIHEELWNSYIYGKWLRYNNYTLLIVKRDPYLEDEYLLQIAARKTKEIYQKPILRSEVVSSLSELPYLLKQVTSLIPYQWILPQYTLINEEDVRNRKGLPFKELILKHELQLINCMKEGNNEKLEKWISDFVDWLFYHPEATPESIQFYVQNLYIETIRYINRMSDEKGAKNYDSIPAYNQWFMNPKEKLFILFSVILNDFKSSLQKHTNYVEDSIFYIEKHLGEPISLQEVAEHISIHPNYLSEMIRKKTGKSYVELLTDLRIKKALDYLLYASVSIKEIARLVGYNDSKYFTKIFKKHFGVTPTQYRRKQ